MADNKELSFWGKAHRILDRLDLMLERHGNRLPSACVVLRYREGRFYIANIGDAGATEITIGDLVNGNRRVSFSSPGYMVANSVEEIETHPRYERYGQISHIQWILHDSPELAFEPVFKGIVKIAFSQYGQSARHETEQLIIYDLVTKRLSITHGHMGAAGGGDGCNKDSGKTLWP